jgi:hypothetical protein
MVSWLNSLHWETRSWNTVEEPGQSGMLSLYLKKMWFIHLTTKLIFFTQIAHYIWSHNRKQKRSFELFPYFMLHSKLTSPSKNGKDFETL